MNLLRIFYNELRELLSDVGIVIFCIILPLAYPLLYAYVYNGEVVREVPVIVVDDDHSALSRDFIRRCNAAPDIEIIGHATNMDEAYHRIERTDAYGIIHIPSSFSSDIARMQQTVVGLYCEMSSMMYYKGMLMTLSNVSLQINKEIKVSRLGASTERVAEIVAAPITYESQAMYNPQSGYASFLIPPVLMLIIQQSLMLGIGMHMGRTRERNHGLPFPLMRPYRNPLFVMLGKAFAYGALYIFWAIYFYLCVREWFDLPHLGDFATYMVWVTIYIVACVVYSICFSVFVYRREDCIMLFVFMSVPLIFLSGVSWPADVMPDGWRYFSYLFPSTFGINAQVRTGTMGAPLSAISFQTHAMLLQIAIYGSLAVIYYGWQLRRAGRRHSRKK